MNNQKVAQVENNLRESNLLGADENVVDFVLGDEWLFLSQTRGTWSLTNKKLIFTSFLSATTINLDSILDVKKCNVGGLIPIIPTGILIKYTNEKGKEVKTKMSVMKRNDWIERLEKYVK